MDSWFSGKSLGSNPLVWYEGEPETTAKVAKQAKGVLSPSLSSSMLVVTEESTKGKPGKCQGIDDVKLAVLVGQPDCTGLSLLEVEEPNLVNWSPCPKGKGHSADVSCWLKPYRWPLSTQSSGDQEQLPGELMTSVAFHKLAKPVMILYI